MDIPGGMEVTAETDKKNAPVYLYLDVKDPGFTDGVAPIVEFSFEYYDNVYIIISMLASS